MVDVLIASNHLNFWVVWFWVVEHFCILIRHQGHLDQNDVTLVIPLRPTLDPLKRNVQSGKHFPLFLLQCSFKQCYLTECDGVETPIDLSGNIPLDVCSGTAVYRSLVQY